MAKQFILADSTFCRPVNFEMPTDTGYEKFTIQAKFHMFADLKSEVDKREKTDTLLDVVLADLPDLQHDEAMSKAQAIEAVKRHPVISAALVRCYQDVLAKKTSS